MQLAAWIPASSRQHTLQASKDLLESAAKGISSRLLLSLHPSLQIMILQAAQYRATYVVCVCVCVRVCVCGVMLCSRVHAQCGAP